MPRALVCLLLLSACSDYDFVRHDEKNVPDDNQWDTGAPEQPEDSGEPQDPDAPVAVCDVTPNPVHPPFESASFIGEDSHDPHGEAIVAYQWKLTHAPDGSAAALSGASNANVEGFVPDLPGDYKAKLTIETADGRKDDCTVTLESIPDQDLWIEMYWTRSGDDMDLHLLAPGGQVETDKDCYYFNCVLGGWLDWGQSGNSDDDPSLDQDDILDKGPENISLPAPQDGKYTVVVHDFWGSVVNDANDVTVNVYMGGVLEWTDTRKISGEDSYTVFAEVDWANRTVTTK